jgi:acetyltransferase-like isoleucine patch superfamily enzyme
MSMQKVKGINNLIEGNYHDENININIEGNNNHVKLAENITFKNKESILNIIIQGNNHYVELGECKVNRTLSLQLVPGAFMPGVTASGNKIMIESGCTFNGHVELAAGESNSMVLVGKNCLFSDVTAVTTDSHCIYELESANRINEPKNILIGDNCWIGKDVTLSKGACLANGTIVAQKSLVTKSFSEAHCLIGGVPAKILKTQVGWNIDVNFIPLKVNNDSEN